MKRVFLPLFTLVLSSAAARAQWTTETYQLQPGWNAIYVLNDCSHVPIDTLLAPYLSVTKVWRWVPTDLTSHFIASPDDPVAGQEWRTWVRGQPRNTTMTTLLPNFGHLVYVSGTAAVTLTLTGKAILPKVDWRSSGANLVGFPAQKSPVIPKIGGTTSGYFAPLAASGYSPVTTQIFHYGGGEITPAGNPLRVPAPTSTSLIRGKAYWVNLPLHSDFTSPVKVQLDSGSSMDFGTRGGQRRLMVTNTSSTPLTVTVTSTPSVSPPAGQPAVQGSVPLLLRQWNDTAKAFQFSSVSAPLTATLAAGASTTWTLVANRASMHGLNGAQYATVLRVTDGSYSDITVPVTAEKNGLGGLWVGDAVITRVQNQLQTFQRNADGTNVVDNDPDSPGFGSFRLLSTEDSKTDTAQEFRLRLIVHVDAGGTARLLSNVYYGVLDNLESSLGFTLSQKSLKPASLKSATRITAVHLPLDVASTLGGAFTPGGQTATSVTLPYTDATNPFLHTYHPDHDNLDGRFRAAPLAEGAESYTVGRSITLSMDEQAPDGDPAWGASTLTGRYAETLTGLHKNAIGVEGRFMLRRLSEVTTLVP